MDSLDLGVVLQSIRAKLTANTGLLEATEWCLVGDHVVVVHPDGTSLQGVGDTDSGVDVLGVNGSSETVRGVVTNLDSLSLILELLDGDDRAEDLLLGDLHVTSDTGEQSGLDEVALVTVAVTTDGDSSTGLLAVVDVFHDTVELELGDLRTLEGIGVKGVAELVLGSTLLEAGNELVVDVLLDEETRAGAAALAVVEEDTEVGPRDGVVNVGVVENNVGGLATKLESNLLQVALGGGLEDGTANKGRTSEGDLVNVHVAGDGSSSDTAQAGDDVNDTRREASFLDQLGGVETGERSLLGGLDDNGVTGSNGGTDLPGPHEDREVPGDDLTADTNGLVAGVGQSLRVGVDGLAGNLVGPAAVVAQAVGGVGNVHLGHGHGLTIVKSLDGSESVTVALEEVGQLSEHTATLGGGHLAPGALEGFTGGGDGNVDILLVGLVNGSDGLLVGRVNGLEGLALGALYKFIVDEPDRSASFGRKEGQ